MIIFSLQKFGSNGEGEYINLECIPNHNNYQKQNCNRNGTFRVINPGNEFSVVQEKFPNHILNNL